ncbi:hypothetical protein DENSPDRAFT_840505 [Dentipellis sp. KUC8613]|nr:hypothetical protein DENSPDRAFT_840505 [Dentipellis sp. KUC8613]
MELPMSHSGLLKLVLLALGHEAYHVAVTSPNPPPKDSERAAYGTDAVAGKLVLNAIVPLELGLLVPTICQAVTTYAPQYTARLLASAAAPQHFTAFPNPFIAGVGLQLLAGLIRVSCYRALGRLFTFELSIRTEHKLVTRGPYSIVRHPSYVGTFCAQAGMLLCTFGPGGWLYEAGWMRNVGVQAAAVACGAWATYLLGGMVRRTASEDQMLRKEFGKEWDEWAERVPYRLIPGVY